MSVLDILFGRQLSRFEENGEKVSALTGIPLVGLDALSSAAYGPEAAMTLLLPLGAVGLHYLGPITWLILALLGILYLSYRQTITAYPNGGGSYTVARENLGPSFGLLAAAALLIDYTLNVAVGIAAGAEALVSMFPALLPHILAISLVILALITAVNLRGARESGMAFALPTYMFVGTLFIVIIAGLVRIAVAHGHPNAVVPPPAAPVGVATVSLWLLLRSFASGCTAMTGVEAVSNAVPSFAEPRVRTAQRALTAIVTILGLLLLGIVYICKSYDICAADPNSSGYQSVLSMMTAAVFGRGVMYYITIASVVMVLALSANTSYTGFPSLCRMIALDRYLPSAFANRGRRLVYTYGILVLATLAALLLIAFGGITDRLIPLFAVGAFLAFTLSQAGMVQHWLTERRYGASLLINGVGALATGLALIVILVAKFAEGAWVTAILIPAFLMVMMRTHAHYESVTEKTFSHDPLDLSDEARRPVVVVPITTWNVMSMRALKFAMKLSDDVRAVHITYGGHQGEYLSLIWKEFVEDPAIAVRMSPPTLVMIDSPYFHLIGPLLDYIKTVRAEFPDNQIAIVVPELVESRWYFAFLHNQRATAIKTRLLLSGDQHVIMINVPWYLSCSDDHG